jgi:hypothetical protein
MRHAALVIATLATLNTNLVAQTRPPAPADSIASEVRTIVLRMQAAVRENDRRALATLIEFPLGLVKGKLGAAPGPWDGVTSVPSVAVFMKTYPVVMTATLRDAILRQNPDSIQIDGGVATVAAGHVVIGVRCESANRTSCHRGITIVRQYKN